MGASTARITAADFLIPPSLCDWPLAANGAGRIGGVRLELARDGERTVYGSYYQQVPLRVLPPFHFSAEQPALVYLLNPTAGLLDGDAQLVDLRAGPGTRAVVVGQSATRIHPCLRGLSTQQWVVQVKEEATLLVLPGPAIPFAGCRYYQRVAVDLEAGGHFLWGDVWLAGRYGRGAASESFQFARLSQAMAVRRGGVSIFRDRFDWHGPWDAATAAWYFGQGQACGSLFVTGPVEVSLLEEEPGTERAAFPTAAGDTLLRWLGDSEAVIAAVVHTALRLAGIRSGGAGQAPWLASPDLAPCHWFSVFPRGSANHS
jgi:urease accessory protein